MRYPIKPVPKPRQTRADKWKKRPSVMRYRAFADEVRLRVGEIDINDMSITFGLPMPKSWSKIKRETLNGGPCINKPDIDNLLKALLDAMYSDDSGVWVLGRIRKVWTDTPGYIDIWMEE